MEGAYAKKFHRMEALARLLLLWDMLSMLCHVHHGSPQEPHRCRCLRLQRPRQGAPTNCTSTILGFHNLDMVSQRLFNTFNRLGRILWVQSVSKCKLLRKRTYIQHSEWLSGTTLFHSLRLPKVKQLLAASRRYANHCYCRCTAI